MFLIILINFKYNTHKFKNKKSFLGLLSLVFYYLTIIILSIDEIATLLQPEFNGIMKNLFSSFKVLI